MDVFKGLPYFLKPGIEEYSKTTLRTENGCSLRAVATTGDSATGDSINLLLIDECALIQQNVIKEFWGSVYPTLSSFKQSQIIVLSTPRGRTGLYYDLWEGAQNGKMVLCQNVQTGGRYQVEMKMEARLDFCIRTRFMGT